MKTYSIPYPENRCPNCERGERVIVPPYSSIVGQMGVHPQGNVCRKWMSPELLKITFAKEQAKS